MPGSFDYVLTVEGESGERSYRQRERRVALREVIVVDGRPLTVRALEQPSESGQPGRIHAGPTRVRGQNTELG
jgi:hypothetical protein